MMHLARMLALLTYLVPAANAQDSLPTITIAAQVSGTVNWELQTIKSNALDTRNGFTLEILDVAGSPAGQIAFLGGTADVVVSDWIWVARQRAEGRDVAMIPYSKAVGGLMVPARSDARSLADLAGLQIGIAGGPVDKSWLILRALAASQGFDLAAETTQVFGAPPIVFKAGLDGEVGAVVNFWHYMARQEAAGMRALVTVADAAMELGLDPDIPLLGYVIHGELLRNDPTLVAGFAAASRAAKNLLAESDAAWENLRPLMDVDSEAHFQALVAGWREGIPEPGRVDETSVEKLLSIMAKLGGEELVGNLTELPEGVFAPAGP